MSDSRAASSDSALFGSRAAVLLAVGFLVAVGAVTAFSLWDAPRRAEVEKFSQNNAVGDTHYFKVPFPVPTPPVAVLTWGGRAVTPMTYEKVKMEDSSMRPVYHDATTGLTIYCSAKKDATFIKLDTGEYLEVKAR